jgi:hypothetical protein
VDFIKEFAPYALNLRTAPIFSEQIYSICHDAFAPCAQLFAFFSQILGALYALRPTFMKSTPGVDFSCDEKLSAISFVVAL